MVVKAKQLSHFEELVQAYKALKVRLPPRPQRGATKDDIEDYVEACSKAEKGTTGDLETVMSLAGRRVKDNDITHEEFIDLFDLVIAKPVPGLTKRICVVTACEAIVFLEGVDHWTGHLRQGKEGAFTASLANIALLLTNDAEWRGKLRYNLLACRVEVAGGLPDIAGLETPICALKDEHLPYVEVKLGQDWGIAPPAEGRLHKGIEAAAMYYRFNPVMEWLETLTWDGVERIKGLVDIFGVEKSKDRAAWMFRKWMIGAVARGMNSGDQEIQMDYMLVLEGAQGLRKSTALQVLAGEAFYGELTESVKKKDAAISLREKWIVEVTELAAMKKTEDVEDLKAFITRKKDVYRPPYGRTLRTYYRMCVFAGTTNNSEYLNDDTGARRFWPVMCDGKMIDVALIKQSLEQLWGEAVAAFRAGEAHYPTTPEEEAFLADEQEVRRQADPWEEIIQEKAANKQYTTTKEIVEVLFKPGDFGTVDHSRVHSGHARRIAAILRRLGFRQEHVRVSGKKIRLWVAEGLTKEEAAQAKEKEEWDRQEEVKKELESEKQASLDTNPDLSL